MAKKKPKPVSPFHGRWHIVSMTEWDEDYLNEEVQAFIEFDDKGVAHSSSATSRASWIAERRRGTASPVSSGRGRGTTRWTRPRGGAGRWWKATDSTG
jgi:hypothetical protein